MGVVLGLLAALGFGSGDYLGGRASTAAPTPLVLLMSQATAAVGAVVLVVLVSGDLRAIDLRYGAAAGLVNAVGLGLLYHGLANGRASLVAPMAAITGALVPVTWGLATGERPEVVVLVGIAVAVAAGGLIAREQDAEGAASATARRSSLVIGLLSGALLGTSFVLFAHTDPGSGLWPVLAARLAAVAVAAVAVAARPVGRRAVPRPAVVQAVAAGVCDVAATAFVVVGLRRDLAVVVAPVASLAPGFTVLWALVLLRERVGRVRGVGLMMALGGLALIASG